jgi:hypothetical protein
MYLQDNTLVFFNWEITGCFEGLLVVMTAFTMGMAVL